jgi:hypothetical protein
MRHPKPDFARPYGFRDFEFVRAGPEGAYWRGPDGMVVRVAAAEHCSELERRDTKAAEWEVVLGRSGAT